MLLMIVSILLITSVCGISGGSCIVRAEGVGSNALIPSPVIKVNNEAELASLIAYNGWQGDGTASNPYIIQNLDINATGKGDAIFIGNTTSYLVIRYCHLYSDGDIFIYDFAGGIKLMDTANVLLESNSCTGKPCGIILSSPSTGHSKNNSVFNNFCNGTDCGIDLEVSNHNIISNNRIVGRGFSGLLMSGSNDNSILYNFCNGTSNGIGLINASNNTISNNVCKGNEGIHMVGSNGNAISNNTCNGAKCGIEMLSASNNTITNNVCRGAGFSEESGGADLLNNTGGEGIDFNASYGLHLIGSDTNTISNNNCSGKNYGICLLFSSENTLSNNSCRGKDYGLFLVDTKDNLLNGNTGTFLEASNVPKDPYDPLPVFVISAILFSLITAYLMLGRKKKAP